MLADKEEISVSIRRLMFIGVTLLLSACGGGGTSMPTSYSLSANVTGLTGSGLTVSVNSGAATTVGGNGTATLGSLTLGASYAVAISSLPVNPSQSCSITNGSGTASANVSNVAINCTAANTSPASTQVTLDATVSQNVTARITSLQSAAGAASLGAWMPIDITGASGQSLILATDAAGDIVLAALASNPSTVLSADSTALVLVRLSAGPLPPGTTGAQADAAIRATATFAPLVIAVGAALSANTSPSADPTVLVDVAAVLTSDKVVTKAGLRPQVRAVHTPSLTGAPFVLISGILSITVDGSGGGALAVDNSMPIPWTVSTIDASGAALTTGAGVAIPGFSPATSVPGSVNGVSLTISQTDSQKQEVILDVASSIVETAFDLIAANTCSDATIKSLMSSQVAALYAPGDQWAKALKGVQNLFTVSNISDTLKECIKQGTGINFVFKTVAQVVAKVMSVKDIITHGGKALVYGSFETVYWGVAPTLGICEDTFGILVNCATAYVFSPAALYLAPGAPAKFTLTAQAPSGPSGLPGGLAYAYSPALNGLFTFDPVAMTVTATTDTATLIAGGGTTVAVTVTDQATPARGTMSVEVTDPFLTLTGQGLTQASNPATSTQVAASLIAGMGGRVTLSITDKAGNVLTLPPGVNWSTTDTAQASLSSVFATPDAPTTVWTSPAGSVPGTVTIGVTAAGGTPWGTAVITVVQPQPPATTCQPVQGATTCAMTLYSIPDGTHSGFGAPVPGFTTTTQINNGVTYTVITNFALGVTLFDNVNGPPLNAPVCNYGAPGCPPLSYHSFQLCAVDGKYTPVSYNSVVTDQVPQPNNGQTCTGSLNVNNAITGYTLSSNGILVGSDDSTAIQNLTCIVPYISGLGFYTTTSFLQNSQHDPISMNLKDGSGSASVSESRQSHSTNSLDPTQNQTSTTSIVGTESWPAEAVFPPQFPNTGITATTTIVPAGQALPPACTVGTP